MSLHLGVNIDHVATLRQARYRGMESSHNAEPCPVAAARWALQAGADSITIHVRVDRRHMQDADAYAVRRAIEAPINLELGNTEEMLALALDLKPEFACLVPETREEVTTEGGLDAAGLFENLAPTVEALQRKGIQVSLFIDPDLEQIQAASRLGVEMVELHTGCFANAEGVSRAPEIQRLIAASTLGHQLGLQVNAGHGINYQNVKQLESVPFLAEYNIGHSIVARSLEVGFVSAVAEMKALMSTYPH